MYATQLNMANYGRSVYCGKNTFSLFALSYSLSKVVSQQPENVFFGAYGFTVRAFLLQKNGRDFLCRFLIPREIIFCASRRSS